ncbi:hypothetical protein [Paenibacillus sp. 32352]|uniref:hypothetical protein n=1 Tax=Paenibacillus sp. 32352 TaxID=1969111 RepID=UPI0009ABB2CE|nr:hypothetical protein [Paenibacillus sp. 32352]
MLKLKKTVLVASLSISLLAFSQSAFATVGLGDSRSNPVELKFNQTITWKLETASDIDWFKWTNNTGSTKTIQTSLASPGNKNYDIRGFLVTPFAEQTIYANDNGPGKIDGFTVTAVQPGDTLFIRISSLGDYDYYNPYTFNFTIK